MTEEKTENPNKKVDVKMDMTSLVVTVDTNQDGQPVMTLNLSMAEALGEAMAAFKKGDKPAPVNLDAKAVEVKFEGSKLVITIDSDRDGEKLATISIDLAEAFDEIT